MIMFKNIKFNMIFKTPNQLIFIMSMLNILSIMCNEFNWLWIIMDMNLSMFLFYLILTNSESKYVISLFMIQCIPSMMLLWSINLNLSNNYLDYMFLFMLWMKLGLFPFNFWPMMIFKNMSLNTILIFSTIQKFIPILLFSNFMNSNNFINSTMITFILLNIFISSIQGFSFSNQLNQILINSSINITSWMMILSLTNFKMFVILFILYMMILINITKFMKMFLYKKIKNENILLMKLNSMLMMLSMIPPFSSFLIKNNMMMSFLNSKMILTSMYLMLLMIMSIYMYFNFMLKIMIIYNYKNKLNINLNQKWMLKKILLMFFMNMLFYIMLILTMNNLTELIFN